MKKTFTLDEAIKASGCHYYNDDKTWFEIIINHISTNGTIPYQLKLIEDILLHPFIDIKDKAWFITHSCNCSTQELQQIALVSAKSVAYLYNEKYPNDLRISQCINITARYLKGLVSLNTLIIYKRAAHAANADDYAVANAAAYAAATAAYDTDNAAYAAHAAAYAAYAAHAAAYAAHAAANAAKLISNWIKTINSFE